MQKLLDQYAAFLHDSKSSSENTVQSYIRDVNAFLTATHLDRVEAFTSLTPKDLQKYLAQLKASGKSDATLQRSKSSLTGFFTYLQRSGVMQTNPAKGIKLPRQDRHKLPQTLTQEEIERLLSKEYEATDKGIRDAAALELLYATGMKINQLIALNASDINPDIGYIQSSGRILPIHPSAVKKLMQYMNDARAFMIADSKEEALFVNTTGTRMSRQGFWKVIRLRAAEAGIDKELTPQMLRHSFALHLMENGARLNDVQEMMGFADIASTQIYAKMLKGSISDRYNRFHPRAKK